MSASIANAPRCRWATSNDARTHPSASPAPCASEFHFLLWWSCTSILLRDLTAKNSRSAAYFPGRPPVAPTFLAPFCGQSLPDRGLRNSLSTAPELFSSARRRRAVAPRLFLRSLPVLARSPVRLPSFSFALPI